MVDSRRTDHCSAKLHCMTEMEDATMGMLQFSPHLIRLVEVFFQNDQE